MFLEVRLVGVEHAIEPLEQLMGAMVGMEYNRNTISLRYSANVLGASNRPSNRSFLISIGQTFAGEESGASL